MKKGFAFAALALALVLAAQPAAAFVSPNDPRLKRSENTDQHPAPDAADSKRRTAPEQPKAPSGQKAPEKSSSQPAAKS